jgi:Mg-chelatase subunit ChlD
MATPHVSGVAALIFAGNPDLSGSDVKSILLSSTTGRYYYTGGFSGLVNAETAVENALLTQTESVNRVVKRRVDDGLDLCFVIDTTGSMGDDIQNAKDNMSSILETVTAKSENFRVAIIDYRDFPDRTYDSNDYPAKLHLGFSSDKDLINASINGLELGYGGDEPETVYSGLMLAADQDWRRDAQKVIIVLGDAPPLDPEPNTNYTFSDVLASLYNADITIDAGESDERVLGGADSSLIKVFSIGTDASSDAADFFQNIADKTGGSYTGVENASEVAGAINDSIEQIEIISIVDVKTTFDESYAQETVELYQNGVYLFEFTLDENGNMDLDAMEPGVYEWSIPRLGASGAVKVDEHDKQAKIITFEESWLEIWKEPIYVGAGIIAAALIILILSVVIGSVRKRKLRRQQLSAVAPVFVGAAPVTYPQNPPPQQTNAYQPPPPPQPSAYQPPPPPQPSAYQPPPTPQPEKTEDQSVGMFCPQCGTRNAPDAQFCQECGTKLL